MIEEELLVRIEAALLQLRAEIALIKTQIVELQQRTIDEIRLGPRPETEAETTVRAERMAGLIERIRTENDPARAIEAQKKHEHEQDAAGRQICTTSGEAPSKVRAEQTEAVGQHKSYIVLCEEERAKGFVRPYRDRYKHVGTRGCLKPVDQGLGISPLFCLMEAGHEGQCGSVFGPISKGCGGVTTMGRALSETYARDPKFYGATFCSYCNAHFPVGEFVWSKDGEVVGS